MTDKRKHNNKISYGKTVVQTIQSLWEGMRLTFRHISKAHLKRKPLGIDHPDYFNQQEGLVTLQYPFESFPVPDNGRYRLHNEIDDCIVCDKCAKVCPVDCIDIEPIRATSEIGKTSDGTSKRIYAARFDIDMGKCCFCGLCTDVCPTECLTMTKAYDFSVFDIKDHVYAFATMTEEEIQEKKALWEEYEKEKQKSKAAASSSAAPSVATLSRKPGMAKPAIPKSGGPKPAADNPMIPKKAAAKPSIPMKPKAKLPQQEKDASKKEEQSEEAKAEHKSKPAKPMIKRPANMKPKIPPKAKPKDDPEKGKGSPDKEDRS